jgi:hypothetical protein
MHTGAEIGIDEFQAMRSPDERYRTAPLNGLWAHQKRGFYHDGRFATLLDVVNHYDGFFHLGLTGEEKGQLVEFMKSLPSPTTAVDVNDPTDFVTQHYRDFLGRDPDAAGLAFWTNEIESCGQNQQCRDVKRINVSAAFFLSIEFQETGYLVERMYKTAFGDTTSQGVAGTVPVVTLAEFLSDSRSISEGVIVNVGDWQTQLENNKRAFALDFVGRGRFLSAFPSTMTASEFVDKLDQNAGGVLSAGEKAQMVSDLSANPADASKRASALRQVAEHSTLRQRESNRAFVLMEYFGYLRRNPNEVPEPTLNYAGWKFWLDKLDQFNGNFVAAEMVKAFISSDEYRKRFGQ